jgi:hypothetical protein
MSYFNEILLKEFNTKDILDLHFKLSNDINYKKQFFIFITKLLKDDHILLPKDILRLTLFLNYTLNYKYLIKIVSLKTINFMKKKDFYQVSNF